VAPVAEKIDISIDQKAKVSNPALLEKYIQVLDDSFVLATSKKKK